MKPKVNRWLVQHHSIISRRRAQELGLSSSEIDWLVRSEHWRRVEPGVYHLVGAPWNIWAAAEAAVALGGAGAALSHGSAAWLLGLMATPPEVITVTVPRQRQVRSAGVRYLRRRHSARAVNIRGLPCTDVVRTLIDCAAEMTADEVDALVDRALAKRLVKIERLAAALEGPAFRGHRGRVPLRERLAQRGITGAPYPSVLESHMDRLVSRHGLPVPKAQVDWGPNRCYRLDYAYPDIRLAIEVDGWLYHFTPEQQRYDHHRRNHLIRQGWTVLHYTWWDVTREPDRVAREIVAVYRQLQAA
jgi:hypothetical protein